VVKLAKRRRPEPPVATVPRLWPNSTVVVLAGGPSLVATDVDACRGQHVIAVKDAVRLAPWAEVLYACDAKWWMAHPETVAWPGLKYGIEPIWQVRPDVQRLRNTGMFGLEADPSGLRTYQNSGGQAINLAVHLGATRILLLGFDMQSSPTGVHHWFGWHPYGHIVPPYDSFRACLETAVRPLAALGVTTINCTPRTALTCFPQMPLAEALAA
jgi:hypothetical protein